MDENIPDLLAFPYGHDLFKIEAYQNGQIIFQDKASCFPAYLLDPKKHAGDIIDTCAAPGNKTTHVAALLHGGDSSEHEERKVFAFERNPHRSTILRKMVTRAGGDNLISIFGSKDFLTVSPGDAQFANVEALLLDPSCSGTGIVGRDDEPKMHLPEINAAQTTGTSKKRKRDAKEQKSTKIEKTEDDEENEVIDEDKNLEERLRTLSEFQFQLIQRAMDFPKAQRITYSTCSIHAEENEHVVMRALASQVAQERGWRILLRHEQPIGLKNWAIRGVKEACKAGQKTFAAHLQHTADDTVAGIADACIRCEKGTKEGTMGFFVAAFMRKDVEGGRITTNGNGFAEPAASETSSDQGGDEEEWAGFSDED